MLRRTALLTLALLLTLAVAACSRSGAGTPTAPAATATTATSVATPSGTANPDPNATPVATPDPSLLAPPDFTLTSAAGSQESSRGSFYWMLDNGLAAKVNYHGFDIPKDPLTVQPGETVKLAPVDGHLPEKVELAVFPKEGNTGPISAAEANVTPTPTPEPTPGATPKPETLYFKPTTDPVATADLTGDDLTWKADLQPGTYFIRIKGTWPNKVVPTMERWGEFAFEIHVP